MTTGHRNVFGEERVTVASLETAKNPLDAVMADWFFGTQTTGTQLVIADASHSHTADGLTLIQHNVLLVADASHAHAADGLTLIQHYILAVDDATHTHAADEVSLDAHNVFALQVQDALHAHSADGLTLVYWAAGQTAPPTNTGGTAAYLAYVTNKGRAKRVRIMRRRKSENELVAS